MAPCKDHGAPVRDHGALGGPGRPSGTMVPWVGPGQPSRPAYDHGKVKHARNQKSNVQSTHLVQWLVVDHGLAQDLNPRGTLRSS
ncbi:hypothetical protein SUGI_0879640 [Cryptomeria japonica]|nr:hypothetical protein SUGI_0879640 [Cryptomeria japonica]